MNFPLGPANRSDVTSGNNKLQRNHESLTGIKETFSNGIEKLAVDLQKLKSNNPKQAETLNNQFISLLKKVDSRLDPKSTAKDIPSRIRSIKSNLGSTSPEVLRGLKIFEKEYTRIKLSVDKNNPDLTLEDQKQAAARLKFLNNFIK